MARRRPPLEMVFGRQCIARHISPYHLRAHRIDRGERLGYGGMLALQRRLPRLVWAPRLHDAVFAIG